MYQRHKTESGAEYVTICKEFTQTVNSLENIPDKYHDKAICRGSIYLGSSCGHCPKCLDEKKVITETLGKQTLECCSHPAMNPILRSIISRECCSHPCMLGLGDRSGNLFVHGSHESIKVCQNIILQRDRYKAALENIYILSEWKRHGDFERISKTANEALDVK